ncbi:MAG: CDP-6-deoxy-delta-3,4-glucoseen reductase [marine bacterium B5-7]|nr:MAG: CDP-6-deoxy-delta-3,4-glucoseen reductase [marine bacterium B5-7]
MSFNATNRKTGKQFEVNPDETLLDAGLRNSIVFPYSCRGGTCGTCKATLISGQVDYAHPPKALSEEELAQGKVLLCQALPMSDVEFDAAELAASGEIQIKILPCRVSRLERAAHDVMIMHLKLPASQRFEYFAGQYIDILLRDGRRRSFSMASRPTPGQELELHIRHVPDGHFSSRVFESIKEKDLLRFQGPFGIFFLREDSNRPAILMAGGTGLAPIKALLERALHNGVERDFHLFWGVRSVRDLYLDATLKQWANEYPNLTYTPVLSEPDPVDEWSGETGFVHESVLRAYPDLSGFEVYACGPPVMIDAGKINFTAAGLDPERVFYDSFEFAVDD